MNPRPCRSVHRCNQVTCEVCCWRAARNAAIRLLRSGLGPYHTITLTIPNPSPEGFRLWRIECRNRVDYVRRKFPLWRQFALYGWFQRDGAVQGIVSLGLLATDEVVRGLKRWEPKLGPEVHEEELRIAIWRVTKPRSIWAQGTGGRRYHGLQFSVFPRRIKGGKAPGLLSSDHGERDWLDAMPVLI